MGIDGETDGANLLLRPGAELMPFPFNNSVLQSYVPPGFASEHIFTTTKSLLITQLSLYL